MCRYLGLVTVLTASAAAYGELLCFVAPLGFVVLITQSYIKREEAMLHKLFGSSYSDYCAQVSRWV
jgi:protein-S-isoprenylcysteine O-methyltransferase Ste14